MGTVSLNIDGLVKSLFNANFPLLPGLSMEAGGFSAAEQKTPDQTIGVVGLFETNQVFAGPSTLHRGKLLNRTRDPGNIPPLPEEVWDASFPVGNHRLEAALRRRRNSRKIGNTKIVKGGIATWP